MAPTIEWPSWWHRSRNLLIELCVVAFLSFFMDCYSVYSIIKWKYIRRNKHSVVITSTDIAMVGYSICLFLNECFCASGQLLIVIDRTAFLNYVMSTQYITVDVLTLVPGWFVFFTNKPLRNEIISLISGKNQKTQVVSISGGITISRNI
uniref:Serpentine receptor class gamma n=1 Tax=Panagrolaimus davidi TaxID=227884 RepID=A0A914QPB7_9BILA